MQDIAKDEGVARFFFKMALIILMFASGVVTLICVGEWFYYKNVIPYRQQANDYCTSKQ